MIKVGIYPADDGGCGSYRVKWPWEAVARQFPNDIALHHGADDDIVIGWNRAFKDEPTEYHVPVQIVDIPDVDVMVFQRPLHSKYIHFFRLLRERGVLIVVDLDDNFDRVDTRNVAWFGVEPNWITEHEAKNIASVFGSVNVTRRGGLGQQFLYTPEHSGAAHRRNVREALVHADLLITSTPSLAAHYGGLARRTVVLENMVNESYFDIAQATEVNPVPIVGWTGSLATHPHDLQQMGAALAAVRRKHVPFLFKVVGTGMGVASAVGVTPDVTTNGWVGLDGEYQREYASFDIALCPLENNVFNEAKSWLKPLEAAALGTLPIMSATAEYTRLHRMGVGLLAKKPRDWEGVLKRVLTDEPYRVEMTMRSHEAVRSMTYDKQAHRWLEVVTNAMQTRSVA